MKSSVETLTTTRVKLAVEVSFEELKPSLDAAYQKIGANIRVPGFRPGKAPARIIDQRVGRGAVLEEAVNDALPKAYSEAVRETGVKALGQPDIEVTSLDDGQSLSFTAEVDIRPEITLPDLSTIAVTVDDAEVADADVDEQLDELRDRFGTLKGVERSIQTGDYTAVDLLAEVDGVEVEGGSAKGLSYEVGSGELIEGLDEAIIGKSAGESASFETTLQQGEFAGQTATITATVNSVKEKELPAADDDFAQLASEFDTIEQLRADLRTRLGRVKLLGQGSQARDKILEQLIDVVEFDVPESAITTEVEYREHDIIHSMGHDDALFEQFLTEQGKTREEFDAQLRENAIRAVKAHFILDAIAEAEHLSVEDAEMTEYLVRQAARYGMPPQDFVSEIVKAGNLASLVADVVRNKALSVAMSAATISDESGNVVDLSSLTSEQLDEADEAADAAEAALDDDVNAHAGHDHSHDGHDHGHDGHDHAHHGDAGDEHAE